jgi:hypothetical protein
MGMLAHWMVWGLTGWLIAIAALVGFRCLNGGMRLAGMLAQDAQGQAEGRPAPERVQLLVMFLIALIGYARVALTTPASPSMPPVPPEILVLLGGSHGIYLSGKLTRVLQGRRRELL